MAADELAARTLQVRLAGAPESRHDALSGLPLRVRRPVDGALMVLVPACEVQVDAARYSVAPGYARDDLAVLALRLEGRGDSGCPRLQGTRRQLEVVARASAAALPELPLRPAGPVPTSRLFGRHLAHGLTPEDCGPLPPPTLPARLPPLGDLVEPGVRLSGAPPGPFHGSPDEEGFLARLWRRLEG